MSYFNNHNHSEYSNALLGFPDVVNKLPALIQRAYDLGLDGITITEHEGISSHIQALNYYEKMQKDRPFTLGLGNEIYLLTKEEDLANRDGADNPYYHFILTALDTEGHHQLRELSTRAWQRAYKKNIWRRPTYYSDLEEIIKPNQGHVIASTACLGSRLDRLLLDGDFEEADAEIKRLVKIFGEGNLYIECQPAQEKENGTDQSRVNPMLWAMAVHHNLPIIPTTDSHYLRKEDAVVHKVYLNSQEGDREVDDFYATAYLMDADELREYLRLNFTDEQIDKMYEWSEELGRRIKGYDIKHNPIIPQIPIGRLGSFRRTDRFREYYERYPNFGFYASDDRPIHEQYFFYGIECGLENKILANPSKADELEKYIARLDEEWAELKIISEQLDTSMASYYSTMSAIIELIWEAGSLAMPARGSAAGFLTCYLLEVTQIDPVPLGDYMPSWRHLNHERGVELPDIDNDSEASKKEAIVNNMKNFFGEDKVLNVATFAKISSKTALERACKGLGISNDTAGYLKSLIPVNRGKVAKLKECVYGDKEKGIKPVYELINELKQYPNLIESALGLEGLITNRGTHAAGVIVCNEPYTNYISAMRSADGTLCTCYDLWDTEEAGCIKFDMLTVAAADKIHRTMDYLLEHGKIKWQGNLKATYYKYIHPDTLDYETEDMWNILPTIYSVFQFDTPISQKTLGATHPHKVMDLSASNSLLRLMPEGGGETPIDRYQRYKESHKAWVQDTIDFGLNDEERAILWYYLADSYGLAESQEKVMRLSMDEKVSGYTLKEANKLRKSIAKKDEKLQAEAKELFFNCCERQGTREVFADYIWNVLFAASMGYSFSQLHSYSYSIIALQELNLNYYYSRVYWNCACLSIEAKGITDDSGGSSAIDYGEVAKAIYKMKQYGVDVEAPSINDSEDDFTPKEQTNSILFGISGISGINAAIAQQIISNRPYSTFDDFYNKNSYQGSLVTNSKFIQLIKAGCFDEFCQDRIKVMKRYIFLSTPQKESLTSANLSKALSMGVEIPRSLLSSYNFQSYVRSKQFLYGSHPKFKSKKLYWLDRKALRYFERNCKEGLTEGVDWWYDGDSDKTIVVDKSLEKILSPALNELKAYLATPECVKDYNKKLMREAYEEAIDGVEDVNKWSFDACSYFSQEHQLANVDLERYSITPFEELSEEPKFTIKSARGREWRQYEIARIAGVVLAKNDSHHYITILDAHNNVVNCNFDANSYAFYKQQLSEIEADGSKTIVEKPWIKRGEALILTGYRYNQSDFKIKTYKSSIYQHKVQRITKVNRDGSMEIQSVRYGYEEN